MKQHYIPRCYLRMFSDNEKSIYTYDKKASKSYQTSMMAVCCEKDIYTLSDEYVKKSREEAKGNPINKLTIEKEHFAKDVERNRGTGTFIHNIFPHICSNKSRKWVA